MNEEWLGRQFTKYEFGFKSYSFEECGKFNVPDLYCVSLKVPPFWIELKVVPTIQCVIPFRKGQPKWIDEHDANGGTTYILVGVERTRELWLLVGSRVRVMHRLKLIETAPWRIAFVKLEDPDCWDTVRRQVLHHSAHKKHTP